MSLPDTIAELEAIVNAADSENTVDGQTTKVDLARARRRLAELQRQQAIRTRGTVLRPRQARINLSGF